MSRIRRTLIGLMSVLVVAVPGLLLPSTAASAQPASTSPTTKATTTAVVMRWSDGDTVVTNRGTVRLIGVDTPETGDCGALKAKAIAVRLAPPGSTIRLINPSSVRDRDRYGRILRFVVLGSTDIGRRQILRGSRARYDSRDGYQRHPRQSSYRLTDRRHADYKCSGDGGTPPPSGGQGSFPPIPGTFNCPSNAPIKGNQGDEEWIYHTRSSATYEATNPEECFATESAAVAAGYRRARD